MKELEKELHRLGKPEPSAKFCRQTKDRLVHRIQEYEQESWFARLLKTILPVQPSAHFIQSARVRLMERVSLVKQPTLNWLRFVKQGLASTLVMTIAVTTTFIFVGGKQPVSASEFTYLQILEGSATVKHADKLIWDVITEQTELAEGDLIQVDDSSQAIVHFFDDSQMRLAENSLILLSRLDISPGYARQGVIEASLHRGQAWVQTLNVDDGFAKFSLVTPDAILATTNASFDVQTSLTDPTAIRVLRHHVDVKALNRESRQVFAEGQLNSYQKITLRSTTSLNYRVELDAFAPIFDLSEDDRSDEWVSENMLYDRSHLATLRDRELLSLKSTAGSLPGAVFYPVKRAKERLNLAIRFNDENQTQAQIEMANSRLSESIVLIERGETERAKLALAEYQSIVKQIAEEAEKEEEALEAITTQVVAVHQKALIAALPGDSNIGIVKQVLNETEALFEDDPVEKAGIQLQNSLESLVTIQDYIASGDLVAAQEALEKHENLAPGLIAEVTEFADTDAKKAFYSQILDTQHEERRVLSEINRILTEEGVNGAFAELVKSTDRSLDDGIKYTAAAVRPLFPDVALAEAVMLPKDEKVHEFVAKVNIYSAFQGQKNQINRLFDKHPRYARDMEFLTKLRSKLDPRAADLINVRILNLGRVQKVEKGKRVRLKIDQAKKALEKRSSN